VEGEFLEGLTLPDAPAFEEWAAAERARLREQSAAVHVALGEAALAAGRFAVAAEQARRAEGFSPFAETPVRLRMWAGALAGDPAAALAAYREFESRLRDELHETTGRDLQALAERVRVGRWRTAPGVPRPEEPPLVGVAGAVEAALATVTAGRQGGPVALLVAGGPGLGKTRLLGECLRRAALEGAVVVHARPLESDVDAPWSTLRALLRSGLLAAPGAVAADQRALAVLAALVPERDRTEVADALGGVLAAVADEQPVAVAVDDLDYGDAASLAVLGAALVRLAGRPVLFIATTRPPSPATARELLRLEAAIGRDVAGAVVRLRPLDQAAVLALVEALAPWCDERGRRVRLARRLRADTGGNPLFAVTLLRSLRDAVSLRADYARWPAPGETLESPFPISFPNAVRAAVLTRLAEVDARARDVVTAAAIGGLRVDIDLVCGLTDLTREAVEAALPALERSGLLTFDGERWVFPAALLAEVAQREGLPAGRLRQLRERAIELLGARSDLEARVRRVELLARVRPGRDSVTEAVAVARTALAADSPRAARRAIGAGERLARESGGGEPEDLAAVRRALDAATGGRGAEAERTPPTASP
jgi:hypothetical protein